MTRRILLPVDGSTEGHPATTYALDLAQELGADVHVLHVVNTRLPGTAADMDVTGWDEVLELLRDRGEGAVDKVAREARQRDVTTEPFVTDAGEVAGAIVDHVRDHDVDLVIMGTHARSGLPRFLLGSVTERVLRASPVPILAVPLHPDKD